MLTELVWLSTEPVQAENGWIYNTGLSTEEPPPARKCTFDIFKMSAHLFDKLVLCISSSLFLMKSDCNWNHVLSRPITALDVTSIRVDVACSQGFLWRCSVTVGLCIDGVAMASYWRTSINQAPPSLDFSSGTAGFKVLILKVPSALVKLGFVMSQRALPHLLGYCWQGEHSAGSALTTPHCGNLVLVRFSCPGSENRLLLLLEAVNRGLNKHLKLSSCEAASWFWDLWWVLVLLKETKMLVHSTIIWLFMLKSLSQYILHRLQLGPHLHNNNFASCRGLNKYKNTNEGLLVWVSSFCPGLGHAEVT